MFGNHGLGCLLEECAHGKSPSQWDRGFWGILQRSQDDVSCVPISRDVVGMGTVVHDLGDIRTVGITLDEEQHDFCAFVQGKVDAVVRVNIGFGQSDEAAFFKINQRLPEKGQEYRNMLKMTFMFHFKVVTEILE